jgi:hypothetical protein
MFHTVSDKKFNILRKRNKVIAEELGYHGIDERIKISLMLLAETKGIQTVWSCSGHTPFEFLTKRTRQLEASIAKAIKELKMEEADKLKQHMDNLRSPLTDTFYFIFAAGRESDRFMNFLSDLMLRSGFRGFYLHAKVLNFCFDDDGAPLGGSKGFNAYPVWEFGFEYRVKDHGEYVKKIEKFNYALAKHLSKDELYQLHMYEGNSIHARSLGNKK